jgi:hypothetical protein
VSNGLRLGPVEDVVVEGVGAGEGDLPAPPPVPAGLPREAVAGLAIVNIRDEL